MFDFLFKKKKQEVVKASIYDKLVEEIENNEGIVSDNFVLENNKKINGLSFVAGALEGVSRHHSVGVGKSDGSSFKLVKRLLGMPIEAALILFEQDLADDFCMASVRKEFYNEMISNRDKLSPSRVANLGYYFASKGTKVETVKLGLSLLGLLDISKEDDIADLLKILGLYEGFTDYVTFIMRTWPEKEKQDMFFEFAKKLNGWGKINVVEELVIDSDEKFDWLLCYGCKNKISNSYLAGIVSEKLNLAKNIKQGKLSKEEFLGVTEIISGFVEDGPVKHLVENDENCRLVLDYLEEAKKQHISLDVVNVICNVCDYFDKYNLDLKKKISIVSQEIFKRLDLDKLLDDSVKHDVANSIRVAKFLKKDISQQLIKMMKKDFKEYYVYCYYLFDENKCIDEFFELCDIHIKKKDYPREMGSLSGFGKIDGVDIHVDLIVERLKDLPRRGNSLIDICLSSPYIRWRNMAAFTLESWTKILGKRLNNIDSDLYNLVKEIESIECNDYTKNLLKKLL